MTHSDDLQQDAWERHREHERVTWYIWVLGIVVPVLITMAILSFLYKKQMLCWKPSRRRRRSHEQPWIHWGDARSRAASLFDLLSIGPHHRKPSQFDATATTMGSPIGSPMGPPMGPAMGSTMGSTMVPTVATIPEHGYPHSQTGPMQEARYPHSHAGPTMATIPEPAYYHSHSWHTMGTDSAAAPAHCCGVAPPPYEFTELPHHLSTNTQPRHEAQTPSAPMVSPASNLSGKF